MDGSLAFIDLSGFTALSERLADHGRVGAEEITDLIERVFGELLALAYDRNASLLKFGGDALLLLFDGADHELRAAAATALMRARLAELVPLDSIAGPVPLEMSAGVWSGGCDLFLVGGSHLELIVTGPAASALIRLEQTAEPGDIVLSTATVAALPNEVVGPPRGAGHLLRGAPAGGRTDPSPNARTLTHPVASSLLPVAVRDHLAAGGGAPEHRHALVGFVYFDGTDRLLHEAGPDGCAEAVDMIVRTTQEVVDLHRLTLLGSDIATDGGKLIVVAGAPVAHQDDTDRILRSLHTVVTTPTPLGLRAGVHAGPLFAGPVGPWYRRTYTVMGDTVNLAARLGGHARPGTVLASRDVTAATRQRFAVTPVPAFSVKGKAAPIDASEVGNALGPRVDHTHRFPLVGRRAELAALDEELARARAGGSRTVEIIGPAGIGKTRLLSELRERHPELQLYYANGDPYTVSAPYACLRGLLRFLLRLEDEPDAATLQRRLAHIDADLAPWAALVGSVVDVDVEPSPAVRDLEPRFRATRLHDVVSRLLVALLPHDAILRFEDSHWIDDASWSLIEHLLTRHAPATGWLVVVSGRDGRLGERANATLALEPLDQQATEQLTLVAAERGLVSLDEARELAGRAAGHPLFLEELMSFSGDAEEIPDTVEHMIASRLDRLSPVQRDVLRMAALLGHTFELDLLRSVTGQPIDSEDLDALGGFVRPVDQRQYEFEHELYRDVAYTGLPFRHRRELHDRVGRVIETRHTGRTEEVAEVLALHYHRADAPAKAWRYNRLAARRAEQRHALGAATRYLRWALEASRRAEDVDARDVVATWGELGDVLEHLGAYSKAADAYRRARELADEPDRPSLWLRTGIVHERQGDYSRALWWYARTRNRLQSIDTPQARALRARASLRYAEVRILQGKPGAAHKEVAQLLDAIEELDHPELRARAHFVQGWALGRGEDGDEHRLEALALYEEIDDLDGQGHVHVDLGIAAYYRGDWDVAIHHYELAQGLKERIGDTVGAAVCASNLAEIESDRGELDAATERFQRALSVFRAAGFAIGEAVAIGNLGRAAARRGDFRQAAELLEEARARFDAMSSASFAREMVVRQAELALFRGDTDGALHLAARALRGHGSEDTPAIATAHRLTGLAQAGHDHLAVALAGLRHARDVALACESAYDAALADLGLAEVLRGSDDRTAATHGRRAAAVLDRLGVGEAGRSMLLGPAVAAETASRTS